MFVVSEWAAAALAALTADGVVTVWGTEFLRGR